MALEHVEIPPLPIDRFRAILNEEQERRLDAALAEAERSLAGRVVWNVNSTARGGGVAEMLHSLIAYTRGAGVDARWVVIEGEPHFFEVTKRIHNRLHGSPGDGGPLGDEERATYERVTDGNAEELCGLVKEGDVVLLHDPQTAGLVERLKSAGAHVVWRAHIGLDLPNDLAREAWRFLLPYVTASDAYVFSRQAFVWEGLDEERLAIIPPSIDPFSAKNQDLDGAAVEAILAASGIVEGDSEHAGFTRRDGTPGRVDRRAELVEDGPLPEGALLVTQVSRWDRLKDMDGVLEGFVGHVSDERAHLLLVGPDVTAVADDPEGAEVLAEVRERWEGLDGGTRARVHLALLPMDDAEENAAMVNAIQRRSDVVVQKSVAEGFGLTVSEGMWKARPVVASRVGGIGDQIVDGESGVLVDPRDLEGFGSTVAGLLADRERAERIGRGARERVRDQFLGPRHLGQYVELFARVIAG
ncbi:MAG: glycosyltransferase [Actinomycetota bacterium]|nr:glycosyltransferase [Actinomycetota bacterium]